MQDNLRILAYSAVIIAALIITGVFIYIAGLHISEEHHAFVTCKEEGKGVPDMHKQHEEAAPHKEHMEHHNH